MFFMLVHENMGSWRGYKKRFKERNLKRSIKTKNMENIFQEGFKLVL